MRLFLLTVALSSCFLCGDAAGQSAGTFNPAAIRGLVGRDSPDAAGQGKGKADDKGIAVSTIHEAAANEIAADKSYGGKIVKLSAPVKAIQKAGGGYIIISGLGRTIASEPANWTAFGEIRIAKKAEGDFAMTKPGETLVIYAQYKGRAERFGAYKDYVVLFENATLTKPDEPAKDK